MTQDEPILFERPTINSHSRGYKCKVQNIKVPKAKHIGNLPLELIDLIRFFLNEDDPRANLKLFTVCRSFYFVFRKSLYENINIIAPHEEGYWKAMTNEELRNSLDSSGLHTKYHQRTLISDLSQGLKFLKLIERREDLRMLVDHLHISCLNLNIHSDFLSNAIKRIMDVKGYKPGEEESGTIFKSEIHKFLLLRSNVRTFLSELFSQTTHNFFYHKNLIPNIKTYIHKKRNFYAKEELLGSLVDPSCPTFHCTDNVRISSMLFQPYKGDKHEASNSLLFLEFLQHALYMVTNMAFKSSSLTALNFINKQVESYYGGQVDPDLAGHNVAFMTFHFYFVCPETARNVKEFKKAFNFVSSAS